MPPRWILAALVGPALLPPAVREQMRVEDNPFLGPLLRDVHLALGIAWPADEAGDPPAANDDDDDAGFIHIFGGGGSGGGADTAGDEAQLGPVGRAVLAARRVYGHVPDALDAAHRVIAARQLRRCSATTAPLAPAATATTAAAAASPVSPPSPAAATTKRSGPLVLGRAGGAAAGAAAAAESGDQLMREIAAELAGTAPHPHPPPADAAAAAARLSVRELKEAVERCGGTCDGITDKGELVQVDRDGLRRRVLGVGGKLWSGMVQMD